MELPGPQRQAVALLDTPRRAQEIAENHPMDRAHLEQALAGDDRFAPDFVGASQRLLSGALEEALQLQAILLFDVERSLFHCSSPL